MKTRDPENPLEPAQPADGSTIAAVIHNVRRKRGLTLAQVAEATDLDRSYLSRIERGQKSPSISTLLRIAAALDVPVSQLFGETTDEDAIVIVRCEQQLRLHEGQGSGILKAILPTSERRRISLFVLEPGQEPITHTGDHPGDETIFMLAGEITIEFPDRNIRLAAGDCAHFDGHLRHDIRRVGDETAQALVIIAQDLARPAA